MMQEKKGNTGKYAPHDHIWMYFSKSRRNVSRIYETVGKSASSYGYHQRGSQMAFQTGGTGCIIISLHSLFVQNCFMSFPPISRIWEKKKQYFVHRAKALIKELSLLNHEIAQDGRIR